MSLEDLFGLIPRQQTRAEMLQSQIAGLRRELADISRSLSHQAGHSASHFGEAAEHFGREAVQHSAVVADEVARQARRGARAFSRDPLPTIAVLGTVVLLASFLSRKR